MCGVVSFVVTVRLRSSCLSALDLRQFRQLYPDRGMVDVFLSLSIPTIMTTPKIPCKPLQLLGLGRSQQVTTEVTTSLGRIPQ
jgi:hypothetical protein